MAKTTMREVLAEARVIYERTMHGAAGCCGDLDHALEYIDGSVGELIQEMVNLQVAASLDRQKTRVGLSGWGDVVMFCERCGDTFATKLQTKTLEELNELAQKHKCEGGLPNGGE